MIQKGAVQNLLVFALNALILAESAKALGSPFLAAPLLATAGQASFTQPVNFAAGIRTALAYFIAIVMALAMQLLPMQPGIALGGCFLILQFAKLQHPPALAMMMLISLNQVPWIKLMAVPLLGFFVTTLALGSSRWHEIRIKAN